MTSSDGRARSPVLIVGVGSELRSDDAAGRRVAERLAGRHPPDAVEIRVVHQLTPELADAMTGRELVIVVDAPVEVREVTTAELDTDPAGGAVATGAVATGVLSHHVDVAALVDLAPLLGERPTRVRTLAVPAYDLALGTALSPGTTAAVSEAVARIMELCRDVIGSPRSAGPSTVPGGSSR